MAFHQTLLYLFLEQIVNSQVSTSSLQHLYHYFSSDCLHVADLWHTGFSCDIYHDKFHIWHCSPFAMHCFLFLGWHLWTRSVLSSDDWLLPSIDFLSCLPYTSLALLLAISCWIFNISAWFYASCLCSMYSASAMSFAIFAFSCGSLAREDRLSWASWWLALPWFTASWGSFWWLPFCPSTS